MENNRELLLDFCRTFKLRAMNTTFQKPPCKLATWKAMGTKTGDPYDRQHFDQLDYVLVPHRWKNGILNVESQMGANIDSDHAPILVKTRFRLKQLNTESNHPNTRYLPLNNDKVANYNVELRAAIDAAGDSMSYNTLCNIILETADKHFQNKEKPQGAMPMVRHHQQPNGTEKASKINWRLGRSSENI